MPNKRMFSKDVVREDNFVTLPGSTQALYFQLGMEGDDDGFVKNPKSIMKILGSNETDMKLLLERGYVHLFDNGVIVILDWLTNNTLRNDRYHPTKYQDEKKLLTIGENGRYAVAPAGSNGIPSGNQFVNHMEPEHNITEQNKEKPKTISKQPKRKSKKSYEYTPEFEEFWEYYPPYRRSNKQKAFEYWQEALETGVSSEYITRAVRVIQKKNRQWIDDGGKYTPQPAKWLKDHGWEDALADDMRIQKEEDDYLANPVMKPDEHVRKLEPGMDIWDLLDD